MCSTFLDVLLKPRAVGDKPGKINEAKIRGSENSELRRVLPDVTE